MQTLETLPEIVEVRPSEVNMSGQNYDMSGFRPDMQYFAEHTLRALEDALSKPYIIDIFQDHNARREWRKGLDSRTDAVYQNNSLRVSVANTIFLALDILSQYAVEPSLSVKISEIKGMQKEFEGYDSKNLSEKMALVRALKEKGIALLVNLVNQ